MDTSVLVAAWRSRNGASYALLKHLREGDFEIAVSVPLVVEYEAVLVRHLLVGEQSSEDVDVFIDYLCLVAKKQDIFYLWRPFLRDPDDDMLLELAVAARCEGIVTHNVRDFEGIEKFGLQVFTPATFLMKVRGAP
jgi:putative PIN family toxin of toxin-antitoxin system